ncbi:3-hydroxyacyl-ACP dehydratase FabZ [Silvanigrella sp.]|jgi:3-hydroxyacyl-[acyl-carrier-protein] dehydratase|uniref:3-hydroxyacyl-ACP dehydratase FabZ n=1 Tax=Silvanigrella sp. TaxID=2024976 RepID=UPI0037C6FBEB
MGSIFDKIIMNTEEIKKCLPHRDPLLLIDSVHDLKLGESIITSKLLTKDDPVFRGHFPENPVYPGVYYIEGIAQTGAILAFLTRTEKGITEEKLGFLSSVDEARFRRPGSPNDKIRYEVAIEKMRGPFVWMKGKAYINDEIAAECKLSIAIAPKKGLNK